MYVVAPRVSSSTFYRRWTDLRRRVPRLGDRRTTGSISLTAWDRTSPLHPNPPRTPSHHGECIQNGFPFHSFPGPSSLRLRLEDGDPDPSWEPAGPKTERVDSVSPRLTLVPESWTGHRALVDLRKFYPVTSPGWRATESQGPPPPIRT